MKTKKPGMVKCIICRNSFMQEELDKHNHGIEHHRMLEELKGRPFSHQCWACDVSMESLEEYGWHISNFLHKKKVKALARRRRDGEALSLEYSNPELVALSLKRDKLQQENKMRRKKESRLRKEAKAKEEFHLTQQLQQNKENKNQHMRFQEWLETAETSKFDGPFQGTSAPPSEVRPPTQSPRPHSQREGGATQTDSTLDQGMGTIVAQEPGFVANGHQRTNPPKQGEFPWASTVESRNSNTWHRPSGSAVVAYMALDFTRDQLPSLGSSFFTCSPSLGKKTGPQQSQPGEGEPSEGQKEWEKRRDQKSWAEHEGANASSDNGLRWSPSTPTVSKSPAQSKRCSLFPGSRKRALSNSEEQPDSSGTLDVSTDPPRAPGIVQSHVRHISKMLWNIRKSLDEDGQSVGSSTHCHTVRTETEKDDFCGTPKPEQSKVWKAKDRKSKDKKSKYEKSKDRKLKKDKHRSEKGESVNESTSSFYVKSSPSRPPGGSVSFKWARRDQERDAPTGEGVAGTKKRPPEASDDKPRRRQSADSPVPTGSRLGLPALLKRDLSRSTSKAGPMGPNLNAARRIRNVSSPRRAEGEKDTTGALKPTLQKLISTTGSRQRVNWNEVYQEVTRKKLQKEKGMPRFGIELVSPALSDPEGLVVDEDQDFPLAEGFQWESVLAEICPPASLPSPSTVAPAKDAPKEPPAETPVRLLARTSTAPCDSQTPGASRPVELVRVKTEKEGGVWRAERADWLEGGAGRAERDDWMEGGNSAGATRSDFQERKRRKREDVPSAAPLSLEPENTRPKITYKNSQVEELLAVSLREEELSCSLEAVNGSLLQARAALQAAYMEVQRLLLVKQQATTEMNTLRTKRIEILQGMQDDSDGRTDPGGMRTTEPVSSAAVVPSALLSLSEARIRSPGTLPTASSPLSNLPAILTSLASGSISSPALPLLPVKQEPIGSSCKSPVPSLNPVAMVYNMEPVSFVTVSQSHQGTPAPSRQCQVPSRIPLALGVHERVDHNITASPVPCTRRAASPSPGRSAGLASVAAPQGQLRAAETAVADEPVARRSATSPCTRRPADVTAPRGPVAAPPGLLCSEAAVGSKPPLRSGQHTNQPVCEVKTRPAELKTTTTTTTTTTREKQQSDYTAVDLRGEAHALTARTTVGPTAGVSLPRRPAPPPQERQGEEGRKPDQGPGTEPHRESADSDCSLEFVELPDGPPLEVLSIVDSDEEGVPEERAPLGPMPAPLRHLADASRDVGVSRGDWEISSTTQVDAGLQELHAEKACTDSKTHMLPAAVKEPKSPPGLAEEEEPSLGSFLGHQGPVHAMQIHAGLLYACSEDQTARAFCLQTRECQAVFEGHSNKVNCLLVSDQAAPPRLYTGSSDQTIRCYSLKTRKFLEAIPLEDRVLCLHARWQILYAGLANGSVVKLDLKTSRQLDVFECHGPRGVSCLASAQEGARLVLLVGSYDSSISVRDAKSGLLLRTLSGHTKTVLCMKVVNDLVFSGSSDQSVHAHNIHTGELIRIYKGHGHAVTSVAILGKVLVTACLDKLVRVLELESHDRLQVYGGHSEMVMCMAIHKSVIYTGCYDGSIQAIRLNLMQNHRCWWHGCTLIFGVLEHLRQHLVSDHTSSRLRTLKCRWRDCEAFFTMQESSQQDLHNHMHAHTEMDTMLEPEQEKSQPRSSLP